MPRICAVTKVIIDEVRRLINEGLDPEEAVKRLETQRGENSFHKLVLQLKSKQERPNGKGA
jgi:hypothetical protein